MVNKKSTKNQINICVHTGSKNKKMKGNKMEDYRNTPLYQKLNYEVLTATDRMEDKSKQEWQAEAFDKLSACSVIQQMSAKEARDKHMKRLYNRTQNEQRIMEQIEACNEKIKELEIQLQNLENTNHKRKIKSLKNKLNHQIQRKVMLEESLSEVHKKREESRDYAKKWTFIENKIEVPRIAKEIELEKLGAVYPKYGFGDRRSTSPFIHEDD